MADERDWGKLQLEWAESGKSVAEFCKEKGIPLPTGRRYLKKAIKDKLLDAKVITLAESDQKKRQKVRNSGDKSDQVITKTNQTLAEAGEQAKQSKGKRGGKRDGAGAPKGNQNAAIHGLMTRCFGEILDYADQANDQFKIKVFKAAQLKALDKYAQYQEKLAEFEAEIQERGETPSIEEMDVIEKYQEWMKSCFSQAVYYMSKEIQITSQLTNTSATKMAEKKMAAQIKHIGVDTALKTKGLKLTDAKTEQAQTAAELNKYELNAKQKEGLGEKDDLGLELDEIQAIDDDEINQRFAALEAERNES
ncbi:hypothetical protein [Vibrio harveyi]|uniref:hypothetical protein n=1 Tax=Vibrio harveyi TaxID=669 RepID=UPI002380466C|nr:hypothetical protein [Vibrio harveyi]